MRKLLVAIVVLHLALGASIVDVTCPESCTCQIVEDNHLEATCKSYGFLQKLLPKQVSAIVRLNINNASLSIVDSKLKYLKNVESVDLSHNHITNIPSHFPYLPNLKRLNLSNNHLKDINLGFLPENLEVIDLSDNSISNFPKDLSLLKNLKTLHFENNPIDCDCINLVSLGEMSEVISSEKLTCHYPKKLHGRSINSVNCSIEAENLLFPMFGDEAISGESEFKYQEFKDNVENDEDTYFQDRDAHKSNNEDMKEDEFEGSGHIEEGSGHHHDLPILPILPKACTFNCSTPKPVGTDDEHNASPAPGIIDQARILWDDFNLNPEANKSSTETPEKETEPIIMKETDKSEVETFPTNDTVVGEMERASLENNSSNVYVIVGLFTAFVVFMAIYYVNKKKNRRRNKERKRNKTAENGFGEEMKPLGKSAEQAGITKPDAVLLKLSNENIPLLNGRYAKIDENNVKSEPSNDDFEDVEIRERPVYELTPQPERVTIIAAELPDSIPKTPMLVHRQLNSDGEIITTTVPN